MEVIRDVDRVENERGNRGYGLLLRTVADTLDSDPDAQQALRRAADDIEELMATWELENGRLRRALKLAVPALDARAEFYRQAVMCDVERLW